MLKIEIGHQLKKKKEAVCLRICHLVLENEKGQKIFNIETDYIMF